ncbi:MAG: ABC transporter substrate-binding protein [Burkholderiales bacterium]|nr:ABC transporter substrate-binding protein [Burkholderiales bacterium]HQY07300.1 ABC transporter substrate-binding protein [Burkholderiaceae bacterium]
MRLGYEVTMLHTSLKMPLRGSALGSLVLACTTALADITVGAPFALSGSVGEQAQAMRQGAELAVQQVNQQGGLLGDTYRLDFADTGCDPDKGVDAVRRLVQSGAVALVGPVCSGVTMRVARSVTIPAGVTVVSVASASSLITGLNDQGTVFRTAPSDAQKGSALARQAFGMGMRSVAVSHASDAYNTGMAQVFADAFKALGGRVTVNQSHEPRQADYQREARAVAAGAADVALFAYSGSGGVQYLKDVLAQPAVKRVVGTDGLMSKDLASVLSAEQLARLTFVLAAADAEREGYRRWLAMAVAARIKADGPYVAHAYDAAFMMALAIEAAGAADRTRIPAALRSIAGPQGRVIYPGEFAKAKALIRQGARIDYDGASGPVDFDAAGDITGRFSVNRYSSGAWQTTLLK